MVSKVLCRKLLRDLWARKAALAALIVIIAIGVGGFVGMAAVYRDLDGSRERYYRECRLGDFTVDLKRGPHWAIDRVADLPNVREVRGRVCVPALIDLPATSILELGPLGESEPSARRSSRGAGRDPSEYRVPSTAEGPPADLSSLFGERRRSEAARRPEPVTGTAISTCP